LRSRVPVGLAASELPPAFPGARTVMKSRRTTVSTPPALVTRKRTV